MNIKTICFAALLGIAATCQAQDKNLGVGAKPVAGAEVILDGSKEMLDARWKYWEGPGFKSSMPIKWQVVADPVDAGQATVIMSDDRAADGGRYGSADIVTKAEYRDFRLHIEFNIAKPKGNSGVYLQNRYEIQILDGDLGAHGMAAVINEAAAPFDAYNGTGKWNSYDITFRAARFKDGKQTEKPMVTIYFNGKKIHTNQPIAKVHGGPKSGIDGGNDGGKGITDTPGGIKLQCEGHDVRYRNAWIKPLVLTEPNTDF